VPTSLKALIVVLVVAGTIFRVSRPIALAFMTEASFRLRRNTWLIVTSAALLMPNYWLYALVAVPALIIAGRRDPNPCALYLGLLYVVPAVPVPVPMIGISILFYSNNFLMLALCIMTPVARRLRRGAAGAATSRLRGMDICLLLYGLLTSYFFVRVPDAAGGLVELTFTGYLRNAFVFFFQYCVPFYVLSRSAATRQSLDEILAMFCLACALMAGIATFEAVRHWLLYGDLWHRWNDEFLLTVYLPRGDSLRAMASAGHPLTLGYLCAIAFGLWLSLSQNITAPRQRLAVHVVLLMGLVAAFSRGPMLGAVIIYLLYAAFRPNAAWRVFKAGTVAAAFATALSFTPVGQRIISVIPFFGGTVDSENITYRQRLLSRTMDIIADSPWLGARDAMLQLTDMRQGQGIIDIINGFAEILLGSGLIGFSLFAYIVLGALFSVWREKRRAAPDDLPTITMGAALISCLITSLILIATDGMNEIMLFCVLPALCVLFARCATAHRLGRLPGNPAAAVPVRVR
jgi:hypothetical protein